MKESVTKATIDRAIVMTQYDLRGFAHPLGFRMKEKNAKNFDAITNNLMAFIHNDGSDGVPEGYVSYFESSFEEYSEMCKQVARKCIPSQKEAIQIIIRDILEYHKDLSNDAEEKSSAYLGTLDKDNNWGKAVLALIEAFEVKIEN